VLVQRPAWIQHGSGLPITSIDFHPDGSKVATAGADGYICIWSTQMLGRDEFSEDDSTSSLLLCTITTHQRKTNTVSCVRFSPYAIYSHSCF
jgi:protein HIRA/HIR1